MFKDAIQLIKSHYKNIKQKSVGSRGNWQNLSLLLAPSCVDKVSLEVVTFFASIYAIQHTET